MRAVNLIPAEQRAGSSVGAGRSQGGAYAVLVLVGGLALMALLYGLARHDATSRRQQSAAAQVKAQQVEAQAQRLAAYASFVALRQQRTQTVESIVESRFDWAHLFHELGRVLPPHAISLSSLSGAVGSGGSSASSSSPTATSSGTSATPAGSLPSFTLQGCAIGQGSVALMLERLRLIDGVSEVTLVSSTSSSSGGSTGSGAGCPDHDPAFTVNITSAPLPSTAAIASATKTVSDATSTGVPAK